MKGYIYVFLVLIVFCLYQCKVFKSGTGLSQRELKKIDFKVSPIVPASKSIDKMILEDGFDIRLIASEPLVSTPVAMSFDKKGRIWVVEMTGYMPDTTGKGEDIPNGKIVILEDRNGDGVMDHRKIAIDSLVLPRSICLIEDGILVAEPPNLWYYELKGDKPVKKLLVDPEYAGEGNVEHQPNGLLRAMDNWIYNAKSSKRYRKQGDKWLIGQTHFRGQWGLSQDDFGRLYYNDNSSNVFSDLFSPGLGANNKNQSRVTGFSERTVSDNHVYPIRPTPGVNRGYQPNILTDSLKLANFTAACAPLVYRGDLFGTGYRFNVFVAEPSANLIKRNVLNESGYIVKGKQAYSDREFLASVDERFRPVNLNSGPDGALYVVDMYRGIIQHKTYVSPYLANQIKIRNLTQPLNCGRIYKIFPKGKKPVSVTIPDDTKALVALLSSEDGFVRDMAQQALVDKKDQAAVPLLKEVIKNTARPLAVIHAMWTLEGLSALKTEDVLVLLKQPAWPIRMQALSVLPSVVSAASYQEYAAALQAMVAQGDELAAPYIAFTASSFKPFSEATADGLLVSLVKKYANNNIVADAIVSSLYNKEEKFKAALSKTMPDTNLRIHKQLQRVINNIESTRKNHDPEVLAKQFPKGAALFQTICQTCHAPDGNGVASLAPPLNKSEWVTGDKNKLIAIVLLGLTGPVKVNGHVYQAPEISGDMPGIGHDEAISDEDIAQVLSFIRGSWQNNAVKIETKEVADVRGKLKGRQKAFTTEELNSVK